jgi:hypothetical protein
MTACIDLAHVVLLALGMAIGVALTYTMRRWGRARRSQQEPR